MEPSTQDPAGSKDPGHQHPGSSTQDPAGSKDAGHQARIQHPGSQDPAGSKDTGHQHPGSQHPGQIPNRPHMGIPSGETKPAHNSRTEAVIILRCRIPVYSRIQQTSSAQIQQTSSARIQQTTSARIQQTSSARIQQTSSAWIQQTSSARVHEPLERRTSPSAGLPSWTRVTPAAYYVKKTCVTLTCKY